MNRNRLLVLLPATVIATPSVSRAEVSIDTLSDLGGIADTFPDVDFVVVPTLADAMPHAAVDPRKGF